LFLTGAVPVPTMGLNASQELDAAPIFAPVTKYSVIVKDAKDLLSEVTKACEIALSGVPGPVHVAVPIDVQHTDVREVMISTLSERKPVQPDVDAIKRAAERLSQSKSGCILVGQGVRGSVDILIQLAELLNWPIVVTPQAKGYIPDNHRLLAGVFGFAGHKKASDLIAEGGGETLLIVGSSLGETATNNYNTSLTKDRFVIQLDFDPTVFHRKYNIDLPVLGDIQLSLPMMMEQLAALDKGFDRNVFVDEAAAANAVLDTITADHAEPDEYNTKNVLLRIQNMLPAATRYTVDIGEFMSYVIQYMKVKSTDSYGINVHFGAMGSGIGSAIGAKLAEPDRPVACITGDGCFFMHGMEILTAKEYGLPILFVIMNNARLGMVYHGHSLQFKRTHPAFEQEAVNIAKMAEAMGIPSLRVSKLEDLEQAALNQLLHANGPAVLEIALVDNNTPPMGDRVKFLSSFGK